MLSDHISHDNAKKITGYFLYITFAESIRITAENFISKLLVSTAKIEDILYSYLYSFAFQFSLQIMI